MVRLDRTIQKQLKLLKKRPLSIGLADSGYSGQAGVWRREDGFNRASSCVKKTIASQ
jgi:hypothetical protein